MIYSMTAFAREHAKTEFGELTLELRSVNQRFLEINFRLPETFRHLEPEMRALINQYFQRGKIDIFLNFLPMIVSAEIKINQANLQQLATTVLAMQKTVQNIGNIDPLALLKWPGIASVAELDNDQVAKILLNHFEAALKTLKKNREKEGAVLANIIIERVNAAAVEVDKVQGFSNTIVTMLRSKLQEKLKSFAVEVDANRLEQEVVLQCQKADIQEELDRLKTHLEEVRDILRQGGVVGRKLDFLMQELNREANTLGSKAVNIESTNVAVELKVLIEQMREQIQNIE